MEHGVVFCLQERYFALPLEVAERVVRAVEVTPVPGAPPPCCGVIDVHGEVVTVVDLRERFGLARRSLTAGDQFLIAATARRQLALWVDRVEGLTTWQEGDFIDVGRSLHGSPHLRGIARGTEGLILVHDLDALLSPDDATFAMEPGDA